MIMDLMDLIIIGGGAIGTIFLGIINFFLRRTMAQLDKTIKELECVKDATNDNKSKIAVIESEWSLKHIHLTEKFDELCDTVKDLTKEIKALNIELLKKK